MQEMLSRREFIRLSGGAAAGAALAGLGLSVAPCKAHAIAGVDDALFGAGVLGLAGLLGVALGYKTYSDIENGTADAVGRSFGAYLSDAANEGAIVASAGADAATVVGAGYSEAQLKEAYARGAWADGLAQSITSTGAGALDWLNARTQDAALAWGAFKSWLGILGADPAIPGFRDAALTPMSDFQSNVPYLSNIIPSMRFPDAALLLTNYPTSEYPVVYFFNPSPDAVSGEDYEYYNGQFIARTSKIPYASLNCNTGEFSGWRTPSSSIRYSVPQFVTAAGNYTFDVINPGMDKAIDTPQSIDPASWGFGVPVIGTDAVIGNDTLDSTGHLLAPGTLGEMMGNGSLTIPWADMVYGAGLGLSDSRVRGIEGDVSLPLGYPIPLDVPVTVSVPLSDTAYGAKTMTLEDALTTGIDTSISRPIDTPITPVDGTPFYPVPVPGSDVSIPSGLPFSGLHWETVFPFNMIYSLTDWVSKNL